MSGLEPRIKNWLTCLLARCTVTSQCCQGRNSANTVEVAISVMIMPNLSKWPVAAWRRFVVLLAAARATAVTVHGNHFALAQT